MAYRSWNPRAGLGGTLTAVALGALVAACGTTPPPPIETVAAAQTAVTAAEQADAPTLAPAELDRARDKLLRAQAAIQQEENEAARRLAEQAAVDARLAEARARAVVAQQNVDQIRTGLEAAPPQVPTAAPAFPAPAAGETPRPLGTQ
jgi:hypothetical protein